MVVTPTVIINNGHVDTSFCSSYHLGSCLLLISLNTKTEGEVLINATHVTVDYCQRYVLTALFLESEFLIV